MQPPLLLSVEDHNDLTALLYHRIPGLIPHPVSYASLTNFLKISVISSDSAELKNHVSLNRKFQWVSPDDYESFHQATIVLPEQADPKNNRFSVISPFGFAVLGRKTGELVVSQTGSSEQQIRITSIREPALAPS